MSQLIFFDCLDSITLLEAIVCKVLRARSAESKPIEFEDRAAFIARLRKAVGWFNDNRSDHALMLCTSQTQRARDVQGRAKPGPRGIPRGPQQVK